MPSASGVYSLPAGYLAVTGATIQASQHNPPLEDIAAALTARLSRDGTAAMVGPLQLAVGTVGAPGAVFSTDVTTGFYKTTSGIGVAVGGTKVAEFLPGGISGARFLGELIPYTGTAALALTVLPVGQTLNRITYASLWAFAQTQIAAGSVLYNNGDGSTSFGIPDLRGRVPACWDSLGGSAAGRLTAASGFGLTHPGVGAGAETQTLTAGQIPSITSSASLNVTGASNATLVFMTSNSQFQTFSNSTGGASIWQAMASGATVLSQSATAIGTTFSNNTGGGAHNNVQPTLECSYLLFAGA